MPTVAVIGAGQAGLACAHLLQQAGVDVVVLERAGVGASWRGRYDRLTLNTDRRLSSLPGRPIPSSRKRWVSRDEFVAYLESYAEELPVRTDVEVTRLEQEASGWRLRAARRTVLRAQHVVVATGANRVPFLPSWAGRPTIPVSHSSEYRTSAPYRGQTVLVVGAGNSGCEIAADLSATSGVLLSVRTPPALFPRAVGPVATQLGAFPMPLVPARVGDLAISAAMQLWHRGDKALGLATPRRPVTAARSGEIPVLDAGLRAAVRSGQVQVVAAVERLAGRQVILADGTAVRPDSVVAATGWRPGLEPLVGHLGVLDERGQPLTRLPGLHFVGFGPSLTGYIHAAGYEAASVASSVTGGSALTRASISVRRRLPLPA
ncbi:MAG: NAD(P)/FAD-dependent oxidoreductase [Actinomycetota bacterium]|nr:NAD(P)/FAD-dependent oxidoreductase [Actinomycetota bacterium]